VVRFPLQYGRTVRFTLGVPRQFTIDPDGSRVLFCRSRSGTDPVNCLWSMDLSTGTERLLVDPTTLTTGELPDEERVRRERMREQAAGLTSYATDAALRIAAFALAGRLWLADVTTETAAAGEVTEIPTGGPVFDPRLDNQGSTVAYVSGGALRVVGADGTGDRALAAPDGPNVEYGVAEHVAAESMGRLQGYWWAPDGRRLMMARVDNSPVGIWYLGDQTQPGTAPTELRYPAAGTPNADVSLWVVGLDGSRREVAWDRREYEYVVAVVWDGFGPLVVVQNRAQTVLRILAADPETGATQTVREDTDPAWVSYLPGLPARTGTGALVWSADRDGTRRLTVDGEPVTPPGLQVREVFDVDGETVLFGASTDPTEIHVWSWSAGTGPVRITGSAGVHHGRRAGGAEVIATRSLDHAGTRVVVRRPGHPDLAVRSLADTPTISPRVDLFEAGERRLRVAVLLPTGHRTGDGPLPVLLDPYGGPAAQRVLAASSAYLVSQWFADQGFAVVVADGRGTPGRGPEWERAIHRDKGGAALDDQIEALRVAADRYPDLDLDRVGIRGWSYGGFLAALAVLRRPDVFHAAVAGAPVTDQRLYDTYWQERYLGHPDRHPEVYEKWSLLGDAPSLSRPLLLIHGLRDDNVHPAHTLRLSAALVAAARPHAVLLLAAASHLGPAANATAHLLTAQARFLTDALTTRSTPARPATT